jgi:outer membrane receptor protein involved in Fe transport
MLILLLFAMSMTAQVDTASLTGLISDPSGAAISDAKVTIVNTATNAQKSTTTSSGGYYTFPSLQIGNYRVSVEKQGFRVTNSDIKLSVGSRARLDLNLNVGAVSESIDVTGVTPLLTTQDAMPGAVIDDTTIHGAPLSARNWDDLLGLVPGVQADRYTEQGGGTAAGRTGGANVHGVRSLQNNFVLDGIDNNSFSENVQELTTQIARPSLDAISEFKVSTNPYSAENGRSPGSLVSVTTKGGTNKFHGSAYEYFRNTIFDARDFFNARSASQNPTSPFSKKPAYNQNQFGGAVGGPVIKDKAFFFFNYEGTRIRKQRLYLANVPTANERLGDFSLAAATANGIKADTVSPGCSAASPCVGYMPMIDRVGDCVGVNQPFPNNQIPANCIDAAAAKILALVPGANNTPASGAKNSNNFANGRSLIDDANSYTGRFDWNANSSNTVFVRYTNTHRLRFVPGTFGGILDGTSTSAAGRLTMNAVSASIGWNHIFNPRVVNEFRIGWGRDYSKGVQDPFGLNKESDFIGGVADNDLYNGGIPRIALSNRGGTQANTTSNLGGVDNWGSPDFLPKSQFTNQYQWIDTLNWTLGRHQVRFGLDARMPMRNIFLDVPALRGRLSFDGQRTGIGLADFLLGYPQSAELATPSVTDARLWMLSGFFQDDFKVTSKLTLNYGLRYDFSTWPYSGADRITNIANPNPTAVNATGSLICAGSANLAPCSSSSSDRGLVKPDRNNFAPRIGVAYQVAPNTVVRAGYGRFYMLFERAGSEDQMFLNPPWLVDKSVSASSTSTTVNNMRMDTGFNLSLDPSSLNLTQIRLRAVNPNNVQPTVDQWNFGIERQLPGQVVATVEYVGTKGTHLSMLKNLNQTYFDSTGRACIAVAGVSPNCPTLGAAGTGLLPYIEYQNLGPIEYRDNAGNSTYHGLEASLQKRFSRGLTFNVAYTWSHSIDQAMEHLFSGGSNSFLQNEHDLTQQRGASDFDTRHRLVFSYVYNLPFGPGQRFAQSGPLGAVVGGWTVSSITTAHTGRPFTIFAGGNSSAFQTGGFGATALADCPNGSVSTGLSDPGGVGPVWFDATKFSVPSAPSANPATPNATVPRLGTCSRNNMYGPGIVNVDFALNRTFKVGEGRSLDFRWEAFNLLNTAYFSVPQHDCSSNCTTNATFGRITSLQGDPRSMQFSLRFSF